MRPPGQAWMSVAHIGVLARSAVSVLAPEREDVEGAGASRDTVLVGPAPWVDQSLGLLQVWPAPAHRTVWLLHEGSEPDLRRRISAVVEGVQLEGAGDGIDLNFRRLGARFSEIAQHLG